MFARIRNRYASIVRNQAHRKAYLSLEPLESRLVPYGSSTNVWPHAELVTLSLVPDGTVVGANGNGNILSSLQGAFDGLTNNNFGVNWRNEILRAAQAWAEKTNLNFALVADNGASIGSGAYQQGDPNFGDIRIGGYNFGTTTLGQAYAPPPINNYSIAGDIQLNTNRTWNIGTTYDLYTVTLHEIGHSLGLYHANGTAGGSSAAVLWSTYNGTKAGPNTDDTNGIRNKYSSNLARTHDSYDASAANDDFATATALDSLIDSSTLTALTGYLDLTTNADVDYYTVTAPLATSGTFTVNVQTSGLSLMSPQVTIYAADQTTVLGSATAAGDYDGATLSVTLANVTGGEQFYLVVDGAATGAGSWQAFNTGRYAMTLNFGTGSSPTVPLPNTQVENGNPLSGGGGQAYQYNAEFRVNTTTGQNQQTFDESSQAVAMDANGNYVVTWSSYGQDGSGYGVYAQRYNAAGAPLGSEFRVNATTAGDQKYATVAMDSLGNFVITWSRFDTSWGDWDIYARRYNAAGVAQGGEFAVSADGEDQMYSAVAMDADGDFVVTWSRLDSYYGDWDVKAQRYNAAGVAQGGEMWIADTANDQTHAAIAADADGNFVITWSSHGQDGSGWGAYARRYTAAGVALGPAFRANSATAGDQAHAGVAMDHAGNFIVTWSSNGQDGGGWGVYAQQYSSSGANVGTEFRVNGTTTGDQRYSSLAMDSSGHAVVVWSGNGPGDSMGVFGQMYVVNAGSGLSNMEAHPYSEFDHDHDHDHDNGCGCPLCSQAMTMSADSEPVADGLRDGYSLLGLLPAAVQSIYFTGSQEGSQNDDGRPASMAAEILLEEWQEETSTADSLTTIPRGAQEACFADFDWVEQLLSGS